MRRIAYLSPLPPGATGIADYSRELLPALSRHLEIDLFTAHPHKIDPDLAQAHRTRSYAAFPKAARSTSYDAVVYQMGNSGPHHAEIYQVLLRHPGIVVLHEYVLHHMVREITLRGAGLGSYLEEMRYAYGETGIAAGRWFAEAGAPPDLWAYPLFERVVDASLGVIVHSESARRRIQKSRPGARIAVVPSHLYVAVDKGKAHNGMDRRSLGLGEETFVVASFGFAHPAKRLGVCLRSFARFHRRHPDSVYLLVGEMGEEVKELLHGELGEGVKTSGWVPFESFLDLMSLADVTLNLRHPPAGETSATCLRLLGLGRPVVVSRSGWLGEIPADCCAHVDVGPEEEDLVVELLGELAGNPALGRQMGRNARTWAQEHHRLEGSAQKYAQFVEEIVTARPALFKSVPPLASYPPADAKPALVAELTGAAVDLGMGEEEEGWLKALAETLVDLDLDGTG